MNGVIQSPDGIYCYMVRTNHILTSSAAGFSAQKIFRTLQQAFLYYTITSNPYQQVDFVVPTSYDLAVCIDKTCPSSRFFLRCGF